MKIEEAIQQKVFKSEQQKATLNLLYTSNWLGSQVKDMLKPFSLTSQQYNVLRILRGQHPKPISINQIRDRMLERMSDASRIVERMVKKGWVERKTCSTDKRLVDVVIKPLGLELLDEVISANEQIDMMFSSLSEKEAKTLNQLLDKVRN